MTDSFSNLIDRHLMGLAYKSITARMGPSAQLLAFVNYDKLTGENALGLESFDSITKHHATLGEIDGDPAFDLAVEALCGSIDTLLSRSYSEVAVEGILSKLFKKKIPSYKEFIQYKHFHKECIHYIDTTLNKVPKNFDVKSWEHFEDLADVLQSHFINSMAFEEGDGKEGGEDSLSGWTKENFAEAQAWVKKAHAESDAVIKKHREKLEQVKDWVKNKAPKDNADAAKIMKIVDKTITAFYGADSTGAGTADQVEELLKTVGSRLDK